MNGSHECDPCPSNTRREVGAPGERKEECVRGASMLQKDVTLDVKLVAGMRSRLLQSTTPTWRRMQALQGRSNLLGQAIKSRGHGWMVVCNNIHK